MLINFAWPRVASNPKPNQTGGLLTFGLGFLNKIPILWTVAIVITLIGADLLPGRRADQGLRPGDDCLRGRRPAGQWRGPAGRAQGPDG